MLRRMRPFNIASIEQPVAAVDLAGMRRVREQTGVAVVADESLCSVDDARSLAAARAADVFNIRIGKCGGLLASLEVANFAHENGLRCQLGTLVGETGILSLAAETFGRRVRGFDFLEGKGQNRTLLTEDIVETCIDGAAPGMGLVTLPDRIRRWSASEPLDFYT
jgi:L-alanine-DL-glutamate epimerase-like enolase superfamily enzyme